MILKNYRINAFNSQNLLGNPACVIPLESWLSDDKLLKIAKINNVSETAFFIKKKSKFHLRWFTPDIEMDLCGHATLATAHCLSYHLNFNSNKLFFDSKSGELSVKIVNELYQLDFPKREPVECILPKEIYNSLNIKPDKVLKSRDYLLVYNNIEDVINIKIDREIFDKINIDPGGVILTSKGIDCDFISRFFTPQSTYFEDPVTGSSHCTLIPYWSSILKKNEMIAKQLSKEGGQLICKNLDDRVLILGKAKTYSIEEISI
ncbi:MAG: PhzF family phenazine biosynthesis protein [Flavobacteriaceae bacterium]|nr:PhzF family phenazine biosynthesis protein [Flavobacteriaceae bacterium]MBL6684547.1 PhzF family phenazine biosynthesis protein [Flavobacteriaceae bacterium]